MTAYSTSTLILLSGLLVAGVLISYFAHQHQLRLEAKNQRIRALLADANLLALLLPKLREIPLPQTLYIHLSKTLGQLSEQIQHLAPNHEQLPAIAHATSVAQNKQPPSEHIDFSPTTHLQDVLKSIKYTEAYLQKQFATTIDRSNCEVWLSALAHLHIDVEREYFIRMSEHHHQNNERPAASNAINHALKILEKSTHLDPKLRQEMLEALTHNKQRILGQALNTPPQDHP